MFFIFIPAVASKECKDTLLMCTKHMQASKWAALHMLFNVTDYEKNKTPYGRECNIL